MSKMKKASKCHASHAPLMFLVLVGQLLTERFISVNLHKGATGSTCLKFDA